MRRVVQRMNDIAPAASPILVVAPRGAGKDTAARLIAELSSRTITTVRCDLPTEELRRVLLGHVDLLTAEIYGEDDAFVPGAVEASTAGVLYLDRVDLLRPGSVGLIQSLLARRPLKPPGSSRNLVGDDVRIVASSEPGLLLDETHGLIDRQLRPYFDPSSIVKLPSLAERGPDLPDLVDLFVRDIALNLRVRAPSVTPGFIDRLQDWNPPNNLADLRIIVERAFHRAEEGPLSDGDADVALQARASEMRSEPREYARRTRCAVLVDGKSYQGRLLTAELAYRWIDQFKRFGVTPSADPRDLAEHLLREVLSRFFIDDVRVTSMLDTLIRRLASVVPANVNRPDNASTRLTSAQREQILVVNPMPPGKSADFIIYRLRTMANLSATNICRLPSLATRIESAPRDLVLVFADDFIGTGSQCARSVVGKITSDSRVRDAVIAKTRRGTTVRLLILACAAFDDGIVRVEQSAPPWLTTTVCAAEIFEATSRAFSNVSSIFPDVRMRGAAFDLFSARVGSQLHFGAPRGFDNCESLVVFEHNAPNDTLPVLWKSGVVDQDVWMPIFPRSGA